MLGYEGGLLANWGNTGFLFHVSQRKTWFWKPVKPCLSEWPPTWDHVCHEQRGQPKWGWKPQMWASPHCPCCPVCDHLWSFPGCRVGNSLIEVAGSIEPWNLRALHNVSSHLLNLVILHRSTEPREWEISCSQPHIANLWSSWDYNSSFCCPVQSLSWEPFLSLTSILTPEGVVIK